MRAPYHGKRAAQNERGLDLYETPACATWSVLAAERAWIPRAVEEPAAGMGAIVTVLQAAGHEVAAFDVKRYPGAAEGIVRRDFLTSASPLGKAIVTNPPYSHAASFVAHALRERASPFVAMLLRLGFLEGGTSNTGEAAERRFVLDERPPARIWVFSRRLPMMHRHGWRGPQHDSGFGFAWFVWDDRVPVGMPRIGRLDWHREGLPPNRVVRNRRSASG